MAYGFSETENATRAIILNKHFIIFFFTFCGVQSRVPTRCNMQLSTYLFLLLVPLKACGLMQSCIFSLHIMAGLKILVLERQF